MELRGKRALVVGLGASGLSALRLLARKGARVLANDSREALALGDAAAEARQLGAELHLGSHRAELFEGVDLIVVSPGVPRLAALEAAEQAGVPVWSEVELAGRFLQGKVLAVTGTNGKSTVTSLLACMCELSGVPTFAGGNLGRPVCDAIETAAAGREGFVVVEVSSFQLERVDSFRAQIGVLLNVSADHLDRYSSFEAYASAKARLFGGQRREDAALVPAGDGLCASLAAQSAAPSRFFGGEAGEVRVQRGCLVDAATGLSVPVERLGLKGEHNAVNACAAALAARLAGVGKVEIEAALVSFEGLPHRMQCVMRVAGITFVDDSKATNVGAAATALGSLGHRARQVVLIAGGKDKGGNYGPLREELDRVGRAAVLIGQAAGRLEREFKGLAIAVRRADSMDAAVRQAFALARAGDAVLLAPACSSFDMFESFEHRGRAF